MPAFSLPLQVPGVNELIVIGFILLPLVVLAVIGYVLVRRIVALPDPSRVTDLEREVDALRERVEELEDER
ncbi:hypothetical protein [Halorubellus sp. PRR65]|uniref:hypothetical protein n=1 Tax=Halorubellus sp. PRR65 TaxID=3098148 RepID=UPI002B25B24D|nr:hypothetical protein [Halorubellus sp. PRR65]